MEVKQNEINVYWRAKNQKYNHRNRPDLQVRQVTKEYLSKKQKMLDVVPTQDNYQEKLLEDLITKIRGILEGKKEV